MKEVTSIPNAFRTFEALRNLGYDLFSSVADVVDNAITERVSSKNISIQFVFNADRNIVCRIQDDGCGMSESELEEAMRLGTETSYEENDLGKFGMGMKTASLSHCDILTVVSKSADSDLCGYRWDISRIKETGEWILLQLANAEIKSLLRDEKLAIGTQGTIVFWDDVFSINRDYHSYGSNKLAQNYYFRLLTHLRLHLGMTYHRFLDGTIDADNSINIQVNDQALEAWDPFCRNEPNTEQIRLKSELTELYIPQNKMPIRIAGFVLPNKEGFSTEEEWKKAKGLLSWNDSQGYYIYRANRIIRYGGWHGTKVKDEHDKLARISIDIDPSLDEHFRITVNKTKVQFPEILYQHLKNGVNPKVVGKAKAKYNKSESLFKVSNNFRRNPDRVVEVSRGLLDESNIKTANSNGLAKVQNPTGTWLSNRIHEFMKYGSTKDFEIVSDNLPDNRLWKIVCNDNDKFKVIVNASHPFYTKIYRSTTNKQLTGALDALIFSLAFAELYNKSDQNAQLFDTFKTVCSKTLERLIMEEIV